MHSERDLEVLWAFALDLLTRQAQGLGFGPSVYTFPHSVVRVVQLQLVFGEVQAKLRGETEFTIESFPNLVFTVNLTQPANPKEWN